MTLDNFSVVLVEPKYDGNIGSVARIMKNFGFSRLVLVNPPKLGKEARAMAMHGRDIMENAVKLKSFKQLEGRFDFLVATSSVTATDKNYLRTPILPEHLSRTLEVKGNIALIFGREDIGLSNEEIESCDLLLNIPSNPEYPTLNLSHSVGILLYELSKGIWTGRLKKKKKFQELSGVEKKVLLEKFNALVDLAQKKDFDRRLAKKTFRQIISRAFISSGEASTMIGIMRKAGDAIRRNKDKASKQ
ncbi:MAG: RNA methyltransferase [Candidatus Altiarchaeales archaeon]|nr:RNA methyltransferase [Candidatus Altiarchaeales archaeon]